MINTNVLQTRNTDVSTYTFSEKKRALAKIDMVHPKSFSDQWTQERVDALAEIFKNDIMLASRTYAELSKATTTKRTNIFDGPSLITVNSYGYAVGPEKLIEKTSTTDGPVEKTHIFKGGFLSVTPDAPPTPMGIAVRILGNAISTRGDEVKAKPVSTLVTSAIPPPIAVLGKDFIKFKGTETDAMQMTFSALATGDPNDVIRLVDSIAPHVPTHNQTIDGKSIPLPLVEFYGKREAKFSGQYKIISRPMMPLIATLDAASTALTKKGQGKFTKDAYLAVPMSSNDLIEHKVTLDDARFPIGGSLLVVSASATLVQFLRANYGPSVVGMGSVYPMLSPDELAGSKFDAIYFPVPLKVPTTGTPDKMMEAARNVMKRLALDVTGKVITYISPYFVLTRPFENIFFSVDQPLMYLANPDETLDTEISDREIDKKGVVYDAHDNPQVSTSHWLPAQLDQIVVVQHEYVMRMLEEDADTYYDQFREKKGKFTPTEFAVLWDRFKYYRLAAKYARERQQILFSESERFVSSKFALAQQFKENYYTTAAQKNVSTRCTVSMGSRKGLLLYSGLLPLTPVRDVLNLLMVFSQHCCRSVWRLHPFTANTYHINKIHARPKRMDLTCMESFTSIYAASILAELQDSGGSVVKEKEEDAPDNSAKEQAIQQQMAAAKALLAELGQT